MGAEVDISVVIPLLNEEGSLEELHERLTASLEATGKSYEILFINDGSFDGSEGIIDRLAEADPHLGVVHFRRNFGKAAALDVGFKHAAGDIIITMDADLQDEPKEIPRFLEKLDEGFDLVSGWKEKRHDPLDKTLPSKVFNLTVSRVSGVRLHDFNCGFKAYRREAVEDLQLTGEMHRFIPVLVSWRGFKVTEIPVEHHPRTSGKSKYGATRLVKGVFDLLTVVLNTRYRARPLHMFGGIGLLLGGIGFLVLTYLTVIWFLGRGPIGTRPLLFLGLLLMVVGVQFVSTGLIAELLTRQGSSASEHYVVRAYRRAGIRDD